jgi:hypothetical protein
MHPNVRRDLAISRSCVSSASPRVKQRAGNGRSTIRYRCLGVANLVTLRDAGNYITKLPTDENEAAEWQAAMEALILVATPGGPTMFARIGGMRAQTKQAANWTALRHPFSCSSFGTRRPSITS